MRSVRSHWPADAAGAPGTGLAAIARYRFTFACRTHP